MKFLDKKFECNILPVIGVGIVQMAFFVVFRQQNEMEVYDVRACRQLANIPESIFFVLIISVAADDSQNFWTKRRIINLFLVFVGR